MKQLSLLLLMLSLLCAIGCKKIKKEDEEPYKGRTYFPVNVGHEVVYEVEKVTKSATTGISDTVHYQIKEITTGTYIDSEGRSTAQVDRFIDSTGSGFIHLNTWAANLLTSTAHRVENSIRYIKLIFPMEVNHNWDGNGLNTLGGRYYKITNMHIPLTQGTLAFDSTCTVLQYNDSSATHWNYYVEKYATKVGLIYKINQDLQYDAAGDSILSGTVYTETLVSYTP